MSTASPPIGAGAFSSTFPVTVEPCRAAPDPFRVRAVREVTACSPGSCGTTVTVASALEFPTKAMRRLVVRALSDCTLMGMPTLVLPSGTVTSWRVAWK
ncbi:hypothetical protein ACFHW2_30000 [Actinomadura sp. LOL_016]|uniref:hypothetical protein n=1 Tax=unclassified Actinomadura TaxID=2626254 RepID=UPI003A80C362